MFKIAIPLDNTLSFYHRNPFTSPMFAIYTIENENKRVTFALLKVIDNPWDSTNKGEYKKCQIQCACDEESSSDIQHITEHYAILHAVGACDYLLADYYCDNISQVFKNAGIKTYKVPPFIHKVDMAIKNFLLGASLASTYKHIHHAS
ncbi:MAG: hypothetical protein OQK45_06965 [Sulfurovum sp.]|nr:hypothetical protein [Sulfurovum sp.]